MQTAMQLCGQPRTGKLSAAPHAPHRYSAHAYRHMRRVHTHHHIGVPSGDADAYLRNLAAHTAGRTHRSQFNKERRPLSADYARRKRPERRPLSERTKLRPYLAAKMDPGREERPLAEKQDTVVTTTAPPAVSPEDGPPWPKLDAMVMSTLPAGSGVWRRIARGAKRGLRLRPTARQRRNKCSATLPGPSVARSDQRTKRPNYGRTGNGNPGRTGQFKNKETRRRERRFY